jgi:hypothetical protein
MRLWIVSDLHVELTRGWDLPAEARRPRFDVMIVAGEQIPREARGVRRLIKRMPSRPDISMEGIHEGNRV